MVIPKRCTCSDNTSKSFVGSVVICDVCHGWRSSKITGRVVASEDSTGSLTVGQKLSRTVAFFREFATNVKHTQEPIMPVSGDDKVALGTKHTITVTVHEPHDSRYFRERAEELAEMYKEPQPGTSVHALENTGMYYTPKSIIDPACRSGSIFVSYPSEQSESAKQAAREIAAQYVSQSSPGSFVTFPPMFEVKGPHFGEMLSRCGECQCMFPSRLEKCPTCGVAGVEVGVEILVPGATLHDEVMRGAKVDDNIFWRDFLASKPSRESANQNIKAFQLCTCKGAMLPHSAGQAVWHCNTCKGVRVSLVKDGDRADGLFDPKCGVVSVEKINPVKIFTFMCQCGAGHSRGPIDGHNSYRCLKCGQTTNGYCKSCQGIDGKHSPLCADIHLAAHTLAASRADESTTNEEYQSTVHAEVERLSGNSCTCESLINGHLPSCPLRKD